VFFAVNAVTGKTIFYVTFGLSVRFVALELIGQMDEIALCLRTFFVKKY